MSKQQVPVLGSCRGAVGLVPTLCRAPCLAHWRAGNGGRSGFTAGSGGVWHFPVHAAAREAAWSTSSTARRLKLATVAANKACRRVFRQPR